MPSEPDRMRIFVACLAAETNTFSPQPTTLADFETEGIRRRADSAANPGLILLMLDALRQAALAEGHELIEGLGAVAPPLGPVQGAAWIRLRDELLDGLRDAGPLDAVILLLHGAMVAEGCDDCESELVGRVRQQVGPQVPIGVALDPHGHVGPGLFRHADVMVAFKEYPHTDTAACAAAVWRLTVDAARHRVEPVTAVAGVPVMGLWHTTVEPVRGFVQRMREHEGRDGILSVSFGHGFPWGDVPHAGAKVWVTADRRVPGAELRARQLASDLARQLWSLREASVPRRTPLAEAMRQLDDALAAPSRGLLVIADAADNPGGGAAGDSSFVLEALMQRGCDRVALGGLVDAQAVAECRRAGVGRRVVLEVGGRHGEVSGAPVRLAARVMALADHSQAAFGSRVSLGPSAWLHCDNGLELVLVSQRQQTLGTDLFTGLGVPLARQRAVVVKAAQHFHAAFAALAREVLYVDTPGLLCVDFAHLPLRRRSLDFWPRVAEPRSLASWAAPTEHAT